MKRNTRGQNANRVALKLTAAIMAHGLSPASGHAQTTNSPPPGANASTNAPNKLPEVVVTGEKNSYKTDASNLPKLTEPLRDTPQSVSVVPREVMDDQNNTTLRDTLRNVAGISLAAGEGSSQGDNLTLRGFTSRNDIYQDGMRDFGSYYRDPFDLQQVEVLKGPSGVVFGRGSTGGVIEQDTKSPQLNPFIDGSLSLGTDLTRRGILDLNEPVPDLGAHAAFRLNLMGTDADVADRNVTENRRFGAAPSLELGLGTPTRLTFSYFHQTEADTPDYGVPWLLNSPAPVARENYYGFRDDYLNAGVDIGTIKLEHDFNDDFSVRNQARFANYARDFRITEPQLTNTTSLTPLSAATVTRNELGGHSVETYLWDQLDGKAKFNTGFVEHTLVAGVEGGRETSDPTRFAYTGVPGTSLLNPNEDQYFSGSSTPKSIVTTTAYSAGIYAIDTLKLGPRWELSGGARWDWFQADYAQSVSPVSAFQQELEKPTWRGAIIYKPLPNGSIYFDYGTSFNPSAETLSLSAATSSLPPEENETFELGTKWDFLSNRLSLRDALFRTEKTNAREPDPLNPLVDDLAGDERVDGAEIEATGRLTDGWKVLANYTYMEGTLVSSADYPAAVGGPLANVPKHTVGLWSTIELPRHFEAGAGLNYVSSRVASFTAPAANGLLKSADGYWTLSAMLKYHATKHIDLQANVYNLTDNHYYDGIHPGHVIPGAGISGLFSANFHF